MKTERIKSIIWLPWRSGFLLITLALACLAPTPQVRAVCQQGCDQSKGNTFLGEDALLNNTTGDINTAIGDLALHVNTTGSVNTAVGAGALSSNTEGEFNTATGTSSLLNNTIGENNTANGGYALYSNTVGNANTASGVNALTNNTIGFLNTASGVSALANNTTGNNNTANGAYALSHNTTANYNTANGYLALNSNTTGYQNMADGGLALSRNVTGNRNVANGYSALVMNGFGNGNTAIGFQALYQNSGSNNVGLGFNAGSNLTAGAGNVCIGYNVLGVAGESNTTRISNVYFSAASGRAVYINSDNKIGTLVSSRRFKEEIQPMDEASEAILALKPVTFHYKKEIEPNGGIMFGLIAEDVEKVDPELVTRNNRGEAETVRYDAVNAMLLNEFLKEHRKVEEQNGKIQQQEATISELKSTVAQQQKDFQATIAQLTARLDGQAAQIQKVSAHFAASGTSCGRLEVNKKAPQVASNDQ
jgi:hypothetical protein